LPGGGPILALGPTANWPGKAWPADRFATLAERLTGPEGVLPGARVAVLGAGEERRVALQVIESIPEARRLDLVGAVDLAAAAACLARAALYVGNDSGLMHIAAAVGTPTLGLFGPSREALYAPWGEKTAWVRGARSYEEIAADPAFDPGGAGPWMADLDIDAVEAAASTLWHRVGEG
jgi:ADP-heptose:LPS heptosyltransferase